MLRCEYDGCTMIRLSPVHDTLALRTAIELTGADFYFDGDYYLLLLSSVADTLTQASANQRAERSSRKAELARMKFPSDVMQ
jgi:hypothetical protein